MSAIEVQRPRISPPLALEIQIDDGTARVRLNGELDLASAPALEDALLEIVRIEPRALELDLARLSFIDSSGLHVLCQAQARAEASGHAFRLANVPAQTSRLLEITGLNTVLPATATAG